MSKRCKHIEKDGFHHCGSYAFNLYKDGIEQGDLCDVHYWQDQALSARTRLADAALDKMADNARELGLSYEQPIPAQEPVAKPCHVYTLRKTGTLCEWEPTSLAFAMPDGEHALYTTPQPPAQPLTDEQVNVGARVLNNRMTTEDAIKSINRAVGVGERKVTNKVISRPHVYPHKDIKDDAQLQQVYKAWRAAHGITKERA